MNHDARLDPWHVTAKGVLHGTVYDDTRTTDGWSLNAGPVVYGKPKVGNTVKCASGRRFLLGAQYTGPLTTGGFPIPNTGSAPATCSDASVSAATPDTLSIVSDGAPTTPIGGTQGHEATRAFDATPTTLSTVPDSAPTHSEDDTP